MNWLPLSFKETLSKIFKHGESLVLLYLPNKQIHSHLQDTGLDTVEANIRLGFQPDLREYGFGAQALILLGIKKMRLMTNNPKKIVGLEGYGLEIFERVSLKDKGNQFNKEYLQTKEKLMGHLI